MWHIFKTYIEKNIIDNNINFNNLAFNVVAQMYNILKILVNLIIFIIPLLIAITYLIYFERKIIGFMQLRIGPNVTGPFGLLQPVADTIKLATKEFVIPKNVVLLGFLLAPVITFMLALVGWAVVPFNAVFDYSEKKYHAMPIADIDIGVIYFMAISSLGVYGTIVSGWSSKSRYALLGSIRAVAQMLSYELLMGICIISVLMCTGSLKLCDIANNMHFMPIWIKCMLMPVAIMFFIAILAETKRHPFDLPEAESELVAGYMVEYSSMPFAMFFFGEYANMILSSALMSILFMGGWYPPFNCVMLYKIPGAFWLSIKIIFILFCFIWIRATLPRYKYSQLMSLCWKKLIPISFFWFMLIAFLLIKNNLLQ